MDTDHAMSHVEEQALDWFVRRMEGLAPADEARFRLWLAAAPGHARAYAQWEEDWRSLDALPAEAIDRLRPPASAALPPHGGWRRALAAWLPRPRAVFAGAGMALLVACGLAGVMWFQPLATSSHVALLDERVDTLLADRSRLQLAPGSSATVGIYRVRREIELSRGLARFEISRDPARPLTVLAGGLRITVVGTRFTVRRGAYGDGVRIAVEEGHVRVARDGWFPGAAEAVDLRAGQAIGSDARGVLGAVSAVQAADLAPWHERRTSFENATLARVLAAFARYGDTGLTVRDPAVAALRVTGTFDLLRPSRFAELLPRALPVQLVTEGGRTEIRAR